MKTKLCKIIFNRKNLEIAMFADSPNKVEAQIFIKFLTENKLDLYAAFNEPAAEKTEIANLPDGTEDTLSVKLKEMYKICESIAVEEIFDRAAFVERVADEEIEKMFKSGRSAKETAKEIQRRYYEEN
ncbi:MAG: hypothetical protein LBV52_06955 [Spirochaetaceae bacterium]|jgi:hypothetical protein|nr:hypothetical protein [Spirochaetaceae bacterium]